MAVIWRENIYARPADQQQRFVEEYLIDLNATQAAICAGYSEKTVQQMGSENLLKPVIQNLTKPDIERRTC